MWATRDETIEDIAPSRCVATACHPSFCRSAVVRSACVYVVWSLMCLPAAVPLRVARDLSRHASVSEAHCGVVALGREVCPQMDRADLMLLPAADASHRASSIAQRQRNSISNLVVHRLRGVVRFLGPLASGRAFKTGRPLLNTGYAPAVATAGSEPSVVGKLQLLSHLSAPQQCHWPFCRWWSFGCAVSSDKIESDELRSPFPIRSRAAVDGSVGPRLVGR